MRSRFFIYTAVLFMWLLPCWAVVYVDKAATGANNGSSWANAYTTVTNCMSNVVDGSEIWVATGIYTEKIIRVSASNVCVYGGFINNMSSRSERDPTNNITALDGGGTSNLFVITGSSNLIDGLRIQNGVATPTVTYGGGINNSGTGLVVANCTFVSNRINTAIANPNPAEGGALYSTAPMVVSNCVFNTNTISGNQFAWGGAIYFNSAVTGQLTIINSYFSGNKAKGDGNYRGKGSAIYVYRGKLVVIGSSFIANNPTLEAYTGGAVDMGGSSSTADDRADVANAWFTNCVFAGNGGNDARGGAIYQRGLAGSTVTVVNCTFHTNRTGYANGSGSIYSYTPIIVKNSIFCDSITPTAIGKDIYAVSNATVTYSCFPSLSTTNIYVLGTLSATNRIARDPCFAKTNSPYDLHERSTVGWYSNGTWVADAQHSPCIDNGDPSDAYANEPAVNGSRLNMGAYGNTVQASKGITAAAPVITNNPVAAPYNEAVLSGGMSAGTWSKVKIYYGTSDGETTTSSWAGVLAIESPQQPGDVCSAVATSLLPDTLYYYACYATNSAGEDWATPSMTFTSGPLPPGGGSTIIHVDKNAGGSLENGQNWYNAYRKLGTALSAASSATCEIWVAQGTYSDVQTPVAAVSNLQIYGGFTSAMTTRSQRNSTNYVTILDGEAMRVNLQVTGSNVLVDGFRIQNGVPAATISYGGGINNSGTGLVVANCTFVSNRINTGIANPNPAEGGAIYSTAPMVVSNCVFNTNTISGNQFAWGGAIYFNSAVTGQLTIINSSFCGNKATGDGNYRGKGSCIYLDKGRLVVIGSSFISHNPSLTANTGGTVDMGGASTTGDDSLYVVLAWFTNCVFAGNYGSDSRGGAIYQRGVYGSTVTVVNCTFHTNRTAYTGGSGGIYSRYVPIIVKNSIFRDSITPTAIGKDIYAVSNATVSYSCFAGTDTNYIYAGNLLTTDSLLVADPLFASTNSPYDLHLKSLYGRYQNGAWVTDSVTSTCIDSGDPSSNFDMEPDCNGGRINMGAYGNTVQASKSPGGTIVLIF